MRRIVWLIVTAAFVLPILLFMSEQRNRTMLTSDGAYATSGTLAGVEIGAPKSTAGPALAAQGFVFRFSEEATGCFDHRFARKMQTDFYFDDSWRRGHVCVGTINGRVEAIAVLYTPLVI